MWAIKILNGPQAGQILPLKNGTNVLGRAPSCSLHIVSPGVSKEHAKIDVLPDKIIVTDLGSRNGTFIDGVQIQSHRFRPGEKIGLHDIFIEVVPYSAPMPHAQHHAPMQSPYGVPHQMHGNVAYQNYPQHEVDYQSDEAEHEQPQASGKRGNDFMSLAQTYIDEVVLPGVYKLPEMMEFRWVLAIFMGAFIVFVTSLSSVPLMRILKASIEKESQRRALTIAKTLATVNRPALMQGMDTAVNIDIAQREPGVTDALIISNVDGNIIAPPSKAGTYPDLPFVHEARKDGKEQVRQIDDNTIGALVPIEFYNADTGSQAVTAYAVVMYDMGTLAVDDSRTLSLFIQTFFIALIIGSILFFFLLKVIEHPIQDINLQLDSALKEGRDDVATTYQFPALERLCSNINSSLSRAGSGGDSMDSGASAFEVDRQTEMVHIVDLIGFGALAVNIVDQTIGAMNPAFEERTGLSAANQLNTPLEQVPDQALKLSLKDLVERATQNPMEMAVNELEFGGEPHQLTAKAVYGNQQVAYVLIVILPIAEGGEYA